MNRPLGITVLAVLSFIGCSFYLVLTWLSLFHQPLLASLLRGLSPGGSGPEVQLTMGALLPVYYLVSLVLSIFLSLGLWKLWNWTRIVLLLMIAISFIAGIVTAPGVFHAATAGAVGLWVLRISLCIFVGWYLLSRNVRAAFRQVKTATTDQNMLRAGV